MKVLVCGSRAWAHPGVIEDRLRSLPRGTTILHGGARGADRMAGTVAAGLGFSVVEFPADWDGLGRSAGVLRNLQMLDEHPDLVLAFWTGGSLGTGHVVREARRRGIPCEVLEVAA